jgi:hypothetical protein
VTDEGWARTLARAAERLDHTAGAPPFLAEAVRAAVPVAADLLPPSAPPVGPQDFIYPH